jgi:hypothetical protein
VIKIEIPRMTMKGRGRPLERDYYILSESDWQMRWQLHSGLPNEYFQL